MTVEGSHDDQVPPIDVEAVLQEADSDESSASLLGSVKSMFGKGVARVLGGNKIEQKALAALEKAQEESGDKKPEIIDVAMHALKSMVPDDAINDLDPALLEKVLGSLQGVDVTNSSALRSALTGALADPQVLAALRKSGIGAVKPIRNEGPKVGRNSPCSCGSGKKSKHCCRGKSK